LRVPLRAFGQVVRGAGGEQNVTGVTAIHHALRNINAHASEIRLVVTSCTKSTGPLLIPMRIGRCVVPFKARPITIAQRTGASGVVKNANTIPSPVGIGTSLPAASAVRNATVSRAIRFNSCCSSRCWLVSSFEWPTISMKRTWAISRLIAADAP
jgi:hypothetical protein